MSVNQRELRLLLQEASELSNKSNWSKSDERRNTYLLSAISAVKEGVSLRDIDEDNFNEHARANGLPEIRHNGSMTREERSRAESFREFILANADKQIVEQRDGNEGLGVGNGTQRIGSYAGLGYFVPTDFLREATFAAKKHGDAVMDDTVTTHITSSNGHPLVVPTYDDTQNDVSPVGENAVGTAVPDVGVPGNVTLGVCSFQPKVPYIISMETLQDVEASGSIMNLFRNWIGERVVRGVGKRIINGNGTTDVFTGLIATLQNNGVVPTIAAGSSANTGGAENGSNSIGSSDLAALYYSTDAAYRNNPKTGFLMSDLTLVKLSTINDKQGHPLVHWGGDGLATIWGKPVRVCPSMPSIAASNVTVIFGDCSYILVRHVEDKYSGIQVLRERYADTGSIGLRAVVRYGWSLGHNAYGASSPLQYLQQHS